MTNTFRLLTSGRVLARSAFWNLVGMAAPMIVAVVTIPLLIDGMGTERFGLLAIVWMGVGYFSLFDLGLGRALTKMVSERLGREDESDIGKLVWTALFLLSGLGAIGAILLLLFSEPLITQLLTVTADLQDEGVAAFRILAVGLPIVVVTAGLIGLLQAHQRFGVIAAIRVPLGILTFAGPLVSLQFTTSIAWATAVLLAGRVFSLVAFYMATSRVREELRRPQLLDRHQVRPLISFGGWLTVTNIVGPLMTYLDRFFVGALLGMSAVAYYVTPYEVLSRLKMLPVSIMGVLFPAMAAAHGGNSERLSTLYAMSGRVTYWSMLPLSGGAFLLAPEALSVWLGEEFKIKATPIVHLLAVGWLVNILARPAFTILQSTGRPDLVAKAHLIELLPYLGLLWWLTSTFGIVGTAAAWTLRILLDTIILNTIAGRVLPELQTLITRLYMAVSATIVTFAALWMLESLTFRISVWLAMIVTSLLVLWPSVYRGFLARPPTTIKSQEKRRQIGEA